MWVAPPLARLGKAHLAQCDQEPVTANLDCSSSRINIPARLYSAGYARGLDDTDSA